MTSDSAYLCTMASSWPIVMSPLCERRSFCLSDSKVVLSSRWECTVSTLRCSAELMRSATRRYHFLVDSPSFSTQRLRSSTVAGRLQVPSKLVMKSLFNSPQELTLFLGRLLGQVRAVPSSMRGK